MRNYPDFSLVNVHQLWYCGTSSVHSICRCWHSAATAVANANANANAETDNLQSTIANTIANVATAYHDTQSNDDENANANRRITYDALCSQYLSRWFGVLRWHVGNACAREERHCVCCLKRARVYHSAGCCGLRTRRI
jgi:hypothetical protein